MAVPSAITDLSTTVASNSPAGSESPSLIDDYLRAQAGFLAQMYSGNAPLLSSVAGTDTITGTVTPTPTAYTAGQVFRFISAGANTTTAVTLNVSSLGAKSVTKLGANALAAGDIPAGAVVQVVYDGTRFQIIGLTSQIAAAINTMTSPLTITVNGTTPITADTSGNISLPLGTANGVPYLNASKVLTSGSALTFDGTLLANTGSSSGATLQVLKLANSGVGANTRAQVGFFAAGTQYGQITGGFGGSTPEMNFQLPGVSAGAFTWGTSGSAEDMRLTSTGLGIGTSSPSARLDVASVPTTSTPVVRLYGNNGGGTVQNLSGLQYYWNLSGGFAESTLVYGASTNSYFAIGRHNGTSYSEQMRIDPSGNLGVGTSSPGYKLDVNGSFALSSSSNQKLYWNNSGNYLNWIECGGVAGANWMRFATGNNEVMRLDTAGNLALGITPSTRTSGKSFEVGTVGCGISSETSSRTRLFSNWTYNSGDKYVQTAAAAMYMQNDGSHVFYNAASGTAGAAISWTQALTLDASGNLGLGVTPSAWSSFKAIDIGPASSIAGASSTTALTHNAYWNGSNYIYKNTATATDYRQALGAHTWYTASSGTAGAAITFMQAMTLDSSSNLSVSGTISATGGILATASTKILSVAASVASNALTLTLNPCYLDFRSSTLTTGVPNTRSVGAAISVVVPTSATLGTVNATAARLAIIAIDNAGTVELAVVNLAGGNNLDETTLISTTAISAAATANNVIYSTNARSNVPFRVVGFVDITEATAGTWATAPTTVQGIGGQALAAMSSLGYSQTWQDVTASRALSTTYYNTTGKPIVVQYQVTASAGVQPTITINGVTISIGGGTTAAGNTCACNAIVPVGASYSASSTSLTLNNWRELR